jgi:competence protein ComGC
MEDTDCRGRKEELGMKNVFLGFGIIICAIISIVIVMTLCGTNMRQNELNRAVDSALQDTVENQFNSKTYSVSSNDEVIADFIEALLVQINSDCTVKVNVLDVDYQKGLLSVEVIEKYKHPIGTDGQVSVKRTVIMEQYSVPVS